MKTMIHDDCGTPLHEGYCPKCKFSPDMQSIRIESTEEVPNKMAGHRLYIALDNELKMVLDESKRLIARGGGQHQYFHTLKRLTELVDAEVEAQSRAAYLDANTKDRKNPAELQAAILELERNSGLTLEACTVFVLRVKDIL